VPAERDIGTLAGYRCHLPGACAKQHTAADEFADVQSQLRETAISGIGPTTNELGTWNRVGPTWDSYDLMGRRARRVDRLPLAIRGAGS
jgi:hypothetical protein